MSITHLLYTFVVSKEVCNAKNNRAINQEELEKAIEKKKQDISDYIRISQLLTITKEEREKQLNLMLDDLSKLMKQRNEM